MPCKGICSRQGQFRISVSLGSWLNLAHMEWWLFQWPTASPPPHIFQAPPQSLPVSSEEKKAATRCHKAARSSCQPVRNSECEEWTQMGHKGVKSQVQTWTRKHGHTHNDHPTYLNTYMATQIKWLEASVLQRFESHTRLMYTQPIIKRKCINACCHGHLSFVQIRWENIVGGSWSRQHLGVCLHANLIRIKHFNMHRMILRSYTIHITIFVFQLSDEHFLCFKLSLPDQHWFLFNNNKVLIIWSMPYYHP